MGSCEFFLVSGLPSFCTQTHYCTKRQYLVLFVLPLMRFTSGFPFATVSWLSLSAWFIRFSRSAIPRWLASRAQRDANQPRMESSMFSVISRTLPFRMGWRSRHPDTSTTRHPDIPKSRHPDFPTSRHPDTPTSRHPDIPTPRQHTHARTQTHTARVYKLGRPKNPG